MNWSVAMLMLKLYDGQSKNCRSIIAILWAVCLLAAHSPFSQTWAHNPYLVEDETFSVGLDEVTVSRWYGDGIFLPDPVAALVANDQLGIYARSPVFFDMAISCSSIDRCYAIGFVSPFPFPSIFKLNLTQESQIADQWTGLPYPEHLETEGLGFKRSFNPVLYLISIPELVATKPMLFSMYFIFWVMIVILFKSIFFIIHRMLHNYLIKYAFHTFSVVLLVLFCAGLSLPSLIHIQALWLVAVSLSLLLGWVYANWLRKKFPQPTAS